jgi:hypothetical protein
VVRAIKVIEKHKHLNKFTEAAEKKKAKVRIDARSVNFVKDFMVQYNMHTDPVGRHIVNASAPPPASTLEAAIGPKAALARDPFRPCRFRSGG